MAKSKEAKVSNFGTDQLTFFERVVKFKNKYGLLNIITSGLLMVFMSFAIMLAMNPSIIFDKYRAYDDQKHTESFNYRMKSTKTVQLMLKECLYETGGIRCFIVEMHNGKTNSSGLSFNYGSMTYEVDADSVFSIQEDYSEFSLERYNLISYVYENGYWCGNVEDMCDIDEKLSMKLRANDTYGVAISMIYGTKNEIGFIGISFDENGCMTHDHTEVKKLLTKYAMQIAPFLDGDNVK